MSNEDLKKETERIYIAYRAQMDKLIAQADEDIKAGKIRVQSIEDFERLVKLDLMLIGEPTERIEVIHNTLDISPLLDKLEAYVADHEK